MSKAWKELNLDIVQCERCPRLREHCLKTAREKRRAFQDEDYWGQPVPNFGDPKARLLIVGLAPAAHGANRTGRMFTGDRSGDFLFAALHRAGFANQAHCTDAEDGLTLNDCAITAAAHCAPPQNKPSTEELANCFPYFETLVQEMPQTRGMLALGQIGLNAIWKLYRELGWLPKGLKKPKFGHGVMVDIHSSWPTPPSRAIPFIACSYHPSQQNTFTGKLTETMMDELLFQIRERLDSDEM